MVIHFVNLAPLVRMKLDDLKSIDKLEQSLINLNQKHSANKKATELLLAIEDSLKKLKDPNYVNEVNQYQATRDKEIFENE